MARMFQVDQARRLIESHGHDEFTREFVGGVQSGQIAWQDLSIRDLFEAYCGREALYAIDPFRKSGGRTLAESADAVSSAAFTNIIGQLFITKVKDEYAVQTRVTSELFTDYSTTIMSGERIPGIGGLGDVAEVVPEGKNFPVVGVNEEWVQAPAFGKRGFEVHVTREAVVQDRTGQVLARCNNGAKYLGITNEKRALDVATGITNNYSRNGTASNTYLTSGAYINKHVNPLLTNPNYSAIQAIDTLVSAITDPNTGEPIAFDQSGMTLLVPTALLASASILVGAQQIRFNDGASNTIAAYAPSPVGGRPFKIVSNAYVALRSGSSAKWWAGQPKNAFMRSVAWDIESADITATAGLSSRMILAAYQVSVADAYWVYEPRYMVENTPS